VPESRGFQGTWPPRRWESSSQAYGSLGKEGLCSAVNAIGSIQYCTLYRTWYLVHGLRCRRSDWPLISGTICVYNIDMSLSDIEVLKLWYPSRWPWIFKLTFVIEVCYLRYRTPSISKVESRYRSCKTSISKVYSISKLPFEIKVGLLLCSISGWHGSRCLVRFSISINLRLGYWNIPVMISSKLKTSILV
jgi:hypothetical protein